MNTKLIGVKEFRQNLAGIAVIAAKKNQRYIVLRKNKPIFELRPITGKDLAREQFFSEIEEARADAKAGRTYTLEQVEKKLGLI